MVLPAMSQKTEEELDHTLGELTKTFKPQELRILVGELNKFIEESEARDSALEVLHNNH